MVESGELRGEASPGAPSEKIICWRTATLEEPLGTWNHWIRQLGGSLEDKAGYIVHTELSNSGVTSCQSTNKTSLSANPSALSVLSLWDDHHIGEASAPWSSAVFECHKCDFFSSSSKHLKLRRCFLPLRYQ